MLLECSIKNFAIISSLRVPFQSGLNILTGETGAGKSIIIDALGLLLGGRGSTEYVRHGSDKAELEALFELDPQSPLHHLLQELGLPMDEDHTLIVRREINIHGKSICRINGQMVTLSTLKEIGAGLVNIHGQHEHQSLLQPERHIDWIDAYGGQSVTSSKVEFQAVYGPYQELKRLFKELSTHEQSSAQRLDLIQFQLNEIVAANLEPNEDVRLSEERKRLSNAEKLFQNIASSYDMLYGDHKGLDCISHAVSYVESASKYDDRLLPVLELLQTASYQLEEVTSELRDYRDSIEFNADGLVSIEKRLDLIQTLRKKYGQSVDTILEYAATIEDELDVIQNKDERLEKIEKQLQELAQDVSIEAEELSEIRKQVAETLVSYLKEELQQLHMLNTEISPSFIRTKDETGIEVHGEHVHVSKNGIDRIEFFISTNVGEPLKPLAKIASGGELSRIMLALRSILAKVDYVETLIFDEVDTGVSGRAAQAIAEKLASISKERQVLCITHLPQVASMADAHYHISKQYNGEETISTIHKLDVKERVMEISRMLGGVEVTEVTKNHAKEMLTFASDFKSKVNI